MIRRLFASLLLVAPLMFIGSQAAWAEEYVEGEDYLLVTPPQPGAESGKAQVVELFWYGCPHCYELEPLLNDWLEDKPDHVEFVRIPAIFNRPIWGLHAQAYYTAEMLEVSEKFHGAFFSAIHRQGKRMGSMEEIREFFVDLGVDGAEFDKAFNSFAVHAKVRRAADLTKKYGITGVPAMVINGKYRTGGRQAGTYGRMLEITEALAEQEAKVATR